MAGVRPSYYTESLQEMFIFPNIKVSHDQYIICTNNMAASNGTVGQTGNDFIISEQHLEN
jgi:hypothetical protein